MAFDKIATAVEQVFRELDEHIDRTTSKTGMKCHHLCGACCRKTDIEASPIEFIPLAAWLYKTGKVDEFLARLDQSDKTGYCVLFSPDAWKDGNWGCMNYEKRGLVCRLFGFGYRLNCDGAPELVTCKLLKDSSPEEVAKARQLGTETPDEIPLFRNYSMQLYSIDPDLAINQLPINQAIRLAIEKLYFEYAPGVEHDTDESDE
ncbi:MAG TPA: YkgJ family cysteine cluster protein [Prolixibacteraceae bacterium]